jgi:hypothetical protein
MSRSHTPAGCATSARRASSIAASLLLLGCQTASPPADWRAILHEQLPLLGHRNFVVVADSAYPLQARPGVRTVRATGEHLAVVDEVLRAIEASPHVRPVVWLDAELAAVPEPRAAGVQALRAAYEQRFAGLPVRTAAHADIIQKLDETAGTFDVLLLKTDLTLPYTSVFIELQCGYWGDEDEAALREALR